MIELPKVTLIAITTRDYGSTVMALKKSLEHIKPADVILFTDIAFEDPDYRCVLVSKMNWDDYNRFVCTELYKHINTEYILLIQHDGWVLDGDQWTDDFLNYDYIGAPWLYKDTRNVGNGGFSLRSRRLHEILATDKLINDNDVYSPEDEVICRLYRSYLEKNYAIRFAPEELAHQFSFECHAPKRKTFGFHNFFHEPFKEFVILKRSHAMGDIIMMEPVMEYFHNKGYRVVLDVQPEYFHLFQYHHYPVLHISQLPSTDGIRSINLDMSYEVKPKQLVLRSYYETCGITDGVLRNSVLNFPVDDTTRLFKKYIVLHVDDTGVPQRDGSRKDGIPHRDVHGVNWELVITSLEDMGYTVIQVGGRDDGRVKMNTSTKNMLMYLIAGADFFIGVDSGPSQIAVSLGIRSIIFFGSVNPAFRYRDMSKIRVIQNHCDKAGCYHSVLSVRGIDCVYNEKKPPCITHTTYSVQEQIKQHIKSFENE